MSGDGIGVSGRYLSGMDDHTNRQMSGAAAAIPVAAIVIVAALAATDILTDRAVALGYATRSSVGFVTTSPTLWGWMALVIGAAGVLGLGAVTAWGAALWSGFGTGWTERAVPAVPGWAVRSSAATVAADAALAAAWVVGVPAVVGIGAALIAGYGAGEYAPAAVSALTVRALIVQTLDPFLGWPGPGGGRLHRVQWRAGVPTRIELRTGPGWSPDALTAVIDAADRSPAAVLIGLTWGYDARRRLLVAVGGGKD
ncbi:hypothetical protein DAVIS_02025 [Mycobacterium marinum]|uniref:Transmembrane protein n=2 Tax=Mycobacterium marinum TaxID=1781 RepID=A0A3E2MXP8_MYCMR|nr:hypothetical protein DAVIS_02025 [Mycobacterium marinum]